MPTNTQSVVPYRDLSPEQQALIELRVQTMLLARAFSFTDDLEDLRASVYQDFINYQTLTGA